MSPDRAKELLPVITAFAERKTIESRLNIRISPSDSWVIDLNPRWHDDYDYRVQPPPREFWIAWDENESWGTAYAIFPDLPLAPGFRYVHVREVLNENQP